MKRASALIAAASLVVTIPAAVHAQHPHGPEHDHATIPGVRGDLVRDIDQLEQKYVALAEAIPQEAYAWRPMEGVRSVSEVLGHITAANYMIPGMAGAELPAEVAPRMQEFEGLTDKAELIQAMRGSFEHARHHIHTMDDAALGTATEMFGRQTTYRGVLLMTVNHMHEHLGQLIAYARSNGVVPPWSAGG